MTNKQKQYLLVGVILFVIIYFASRIVTTGTLEVGIWDWGVDMGYTQLLLGILFIGLALFILFYHKQNLFRMIEVDRARVILASTTVLLAVLVLFGFHFIAHDPQLDLYHRNNTDWGKSLDKINHLLTAFIITIIALKISPRRSTIMLVWLVAALYELFEIVFVYNFAVQTFEEWLFPEIEDVMGDLLFNSIGVALATFYMRKQIKR